LEQQSEVLDTLHSLTDTTAPWATNGLELEENHKALRGSSQDVQ
jgi:hypothetical protein